MCRRQPDRAAWAMAEQHHAQEVVEAVTGSLQSAGSLARAAMQPRGRRRRSVLLPWARTSLLAVMSAAGGGHVDPETATGHRGTPRRTPRWPRCRSRARSRPSAHAAPARRRGTPRRRAGRTPRCSRGSSPSPGVLDPVRPGRPRAIGISMSGGLFGQRRSVVELHHRVDHLLRVHHDVDAGRRRCRTAGGPRSPRAPC